MISWREQLREAILDYRYLLDRGYGSKASLDIVTGRYGLTREERLLLFRCIHPWRRAEEIRNKMGIKEPIILDGFNIGITLINAWDGEQLFLCDDGFVRDLSVGRKKGDSRLVSALLVAGELLISLGLDFSIILDSQISRSGEVAKELREAGLSVDVVGRADKEVIIRGGTSVTSDFVILLKSGNVFDIISFLVDRSQIIRINEFANLDP